MRLAGCKAHHLLQQDLDLQLLDPISNDVQMQSMKNAIRLTAKCTQFLTDFGIQP